MESSSFVASEEVHKEPGKPIDPEDECCRQAGGLGDKASSLNLRREAAGPCVVCSLRRPGAGSAALIPETQTRDKYTVFFAAGSTVTFYTGMSN